MEYKTFSILDLKNWLLRNEQNGLTPKVISFVRAYALINNPCALDNDPALEVVFDDDGAAVGYTGVFAENYKEGSIQGRLFWGTTEWVATELRGKGIASKMMHEIKEAVGYQKYLGLASSIASVKLDKKQGSSIRYFPQYKLKLKEERSLKGRCASRYVSFVNNSFFNKLSIYSYENRYVQYVDQNTYRFIVAHSTHDLFLRKQEMFNWLLRYPFLQPIGKDQYVKQDSYEFSNYVNLYKMNAVQVWVDGVMGGFYIANQIDNTCTLRYLYYEEQYSNEVFASVVRCMVETGSVEIRFFSKDLFGFMEKNGLKWLNKKSVYEQISFTTPRDFVYDDSLSLQGGDGDMLT